MISYLPDTINQYSSSTRSTVASLIRQMKVGKSDLSTLVNRVSGTVVDQNFSAANIPMFSVLSKEIMIDSFRNIFLRLQSFYSAANATGVALSSMVDVFSSEIEKAESDLSKLELFIDNYEFISGKDDLYNSNYIEKFDSFSNDYKFAFDKLKRFKLKISLNIVKNAIFAPFRKNFSHFKNCFQVKKMKLLKISLQKVSK